MSTKSIEELTLPSPASRADTSVVAAGTTATTTRRLLTCGLVAGPIYVAVGVTEMLTRPGYDIRKHALSIMANGDWGWIHSAMLTSTGLLTIAGAVGLGRALAPGRGATWGPRLLGLFGLGVTGAGIFRADPALGFPPGTPADYMAISWHGGLHGLFGGIGFLGLIAACLILARRFAGRGRRGLAIHAAATGIFYFAALAGLFAGGQLGPTALAVTIIAFTLAVALAWVFITTLLARLLADPAVAD